MKRKQFIKLGIATLLTVISLYTPINLATNHTTENIVTAQEYKTKENGTLPFKHKRQLVLESWMTKVVPHSHIFS